MTVSKLELVSGTLAMNSGVDWKADLRLLYSIRNS